ncbi:acyltransferase [Thalassotalea fonticola]|uniref:Acyltransferase n=1 Tax=Thalassotalea fonticola TaxID=3065649 RepID=A0ABZ0GMD3_9GAMM|nr:acyltransferase [Colwelliaceae bacterium S1-1]
MKAPDMDHSRTTKLATTKTFHRHLHIFRALTIILIVAAHSWSTPIFYYTPDFSIEPKLKLLSSVTETLFHDGTIIFALISGLLFSLVLRGKGWHRFYASKIKNVLFPYVIMTFIYTFIHWKVTFIGFYEIKPDTIMGYLTAGLANIPSGLAGFHLWYIPVLLILFIVTPVVSVIINKKSWLLLYLIVFAPFVASRVWPEFSWLSVIYFGGAYTLGVFIGANYEKSLQFIRQRTITLVIIFIVTSLFLVFFYQIDFDKIGFVSILESVFYLQKLAMAGLLLSIVYRVEEHVPKWIDRIGDYSFSIYFIHPVLAITLVELLKSQGYLSNEPFFVIVLGMLILLYCVGISMLISMMIKRLLGKYSRMIIGT